MDLNSKNQAQELMNTLITKSWEDSNFKKQLIADPVATIEQVSGDKLVLPKGVNIVVNDFTEVDYDYMIIPAQPDFDELALSEEQLETIAGGYTPTTVVIAGVALFRLGTYLHESWED